MKSFLTLLQSRVLAYYPIFILSLLIACICFPHYNLWFSSGVDEPLPWAFNYMADGHMLLGKNILFPHGPLAFFLYPLPVSNNLIICGTVFFGCSFLLSLGLFSINRFKKQENYFLLTALLLFLLPILDIQMVLIALTLVNVILFHLSNKKPYLVLAICFCVFNLFIKTYGGVICGLIIAGEFVHILAVRKNTRLGGFIIACFLCTFYLFWLSLYHTFSGSLNFLIGQYQLSSDNSEAVSIYDENNWLLLGASLVCLAAIPFFTKNTLSRHLFLIMLLPFFAAWKHAMARSDELHMNGFLNFMILFSFILLAIGQEKRIAVIVLCLGSIVLFSINLASKGYLNQKPIYVMRIFNLYELVANYKQIETDRNELSKRNIAFKQLPDTVLRLIGKSTVDVFPWNYSIIPANNFNWVPRPVIHSYAAYTRWLDARNADHIRSPQAARFLVWEMINTNDNGHTIESIDDKYQLNDGPETMIALLSSYQLKFKNENYLVFEKRPKAPVVSEQVISGPKEIPYDTWVDVPEPVTGSVTRARLSIQKTMKGRLKSLFYKGETFFIFYEMADKKVYVHSLVPETAKQGLWLEPFVLNPERNYLEPPVKRIKIICLDLHMVEPGFKLAFEQIHFEGTGNVKNPELQDYFFGKHEQPKQRTLFSADNFTDKLTNAAHWIEDAGANKVANGSAKQLCYELKPGQYSGRYSIQFPKDSVSPNLRFIQFYARARVKASKNAKAFLVVAQADDNGTTFRWHKTINDMITDNGQEWRFVYFSQKLLARQINFDKPFSFYLWNADDLQSIWFDDLSVSIEGIYE